MQICSGFGYCIVGLRGDNCLDWWVEYDSYFGFKPDAKSGKKRAHTCSHVRTIFYLPDLKRLVIFEFVCFGFEKLKCIKTGLVR